MTDAAGRSVPGLRTDDIVVLEDGVAQPVSLFVREEWPVRLQLLLDGSGSMSGVMPVAKRAARKLLGTLRDGDEAEVAQFNRRVTVLQPSTGDRYVPLNTRADGAWRRLAVNARRNDRNLIVSHRTGYYAPAGEPSFRILPVSAR